MDDEARKRLVDAAPKMLEVLRTCRSNVRSLGPAGAIDPFAPYLEWLRVIDEVIAEATDAKSCPQHDLFSESAA